MIVALGIRSDANAINRTTAYGALAPVPGDVDLLVAGTSCVDYSNLNNEKQDIDANGESGRTFRGMMSWVKNHRPPLVILENVCGAPWEKVVDYFERCGYSASYLRVDTKTFYIPHTRTRVYLLAVDQKRSSLPPEWKTLIGELKRPASSTLDAFLLPSDDPRIHQARQKLAREAHQTIGGTRGRTDWNRCESRHQRARLDEQLGTKRPLTSWEEGKCSLQMCVILVSYSDRRWLLQAAGLRLERLGHWASRASMGSHGY